MRWRYREGFSFNASDMNIMYWKISDVIWDFSQIDFWYNYRPNLSVILCDSSEIPPGFTLLLLLPRGRASRSVFSSCVRMNDRLCISSSKFRKITCCLVFRNVTPHGPCSSEAFGSLVEYDFAHCFVGEFWLPCASTWIERCNSWHPSHVVNDIVKSGCHFVAIGHKLGNHTDIFSSGRIQTCAFNESHKVPIGRFAKSILEGSN